MVEMGQVVSKEKIKYLKISKFKAFWLPWQQTFSMGDHNLKESIQETFLWNLMEIDHVV